MPFLGAVPARGRRTVTSRIRAAGLSRHFRPRYNAIAAAGKNAEPLAARWLARAIKPLLVGVPRVVPATDDTPTPRPGPHVQGAGIHHNPAPGPAGSRFVHGHVFVALAVLVRPGARGMTALPPPAKPYVRKENPPGVKPHDAEPLRTEVQTAEEVLRRADRRLTTLDEPTRLVTGGA